MKWKIFFLKFDFFLWNNPPTRHLKYKRIDFRWAQNLTEKNQIQTEKTVE